MNTTPKITDPEVRAIIVDVLCGQALADHLGDVRDAESSLWDLLGVPRIFPNDYTSAWEVTCFRLGYAGIPLPEHLQGPNYEDE